MGVLQVVVSNSLVNVASQGLQTPAMVVTIGTVVFVLVTLLRWMVLPKPIPGIPYNKASANRIAGDIPSMKKAGRMRLWMRDQLVLHNSPIAQVFLVPLGKPWLVVSDFREARHVMMRRTRQFDRSSLTTDSFGGVMPVSHVGMKTADPRFKHNKDLVRDLMTPEFLNEVSAPEIHQKTTSLLDLWACKTRAANGRPFQADRDIFMLALDITMAVMLDLPQSNTMLEKHITHLKSQHGLEPAENRRPTADDEPFPFSSLPLDPELDACVYLTNSIGLAINSPLPRVFNWLYLRRAESRRALRLKRQLIRRNIDNALARLERRETNGHEAVEEEKREMQKKKTKLTCAVDQILLREMESAEKRQVEPDFHKDSIYDELFGLIVGGHDTTSTAIAWSVKYLARFPRVQSRLRAALHAAHHDNTTFPSPNQAGHTRSRLPTPSQITDTPIPYLDAIIEEILRHAHIVPTIVREALADTQILGGHPVPSGTQLLFLSNGPGFVLPGWEGEGESQGRGGGSGNGSWDAEDVASFRPERWLVGGAEPGPKDKDTIHHHHDSSSSGSTFDPCAGPTLPFGAGRRGCFGRRLAYLEMRIVLTLLVWRFEFLDTGNADLDGFEVVDRATEAPARCFVRLRV